MSLTVEDLKAIKELVRSEIDEALDAKLDQKLDEKLGLFPTREEFFKHLDEIMTELKAIRQEQEFQTYRLRDHEDRINKLEDVVTPSKAK
jgi:DNA repair ATPase RecN